MVLLGGLTKIALVLRRAKLQSMYGEFPLFELLKEVKAEGWHVLDSYEKQGVLRGDWKKAIALFGESMNTSVYRCASHTSVGMIEHHGTDRWFDKPKNEHDIAMLKQHHLTPKQFLWASASFHEVWQHYRGDAPHVFLIYNKLRLRRIEERVFTSDSFSHALRAVIIIDIA